MEFFACGVHGSLLEVCKYLESTDRCSLLVTSAVILRLQNASFEPGGIEQCSCRYCYYSVFILNLAFSQGFLEVTVLFYGYYTVDAAWLNVLRYNLPLAYLLTTFAYLALSLFWIIKR